MPAQGRGSLGTDSRAQAPGSIPQLGGVPGTQMARQGLRAASSRGVFWVSVRTATPGAALACPTAEQPGVLRRKKVLCLPQVFRFCKSSIVKEDTLHPPPSRPCLWGPSQPCSASSPPQGARPKPHPSPPQKSQLNHPFSRALRTGSQSEAFPWQRSTFPS